MFPRRLRPSGEKSPVLGGLGTERSPSQRKRRGLMKRSLRRSTIGMVAVLFMSAAMAKADVVLDWNAIMTSTVVAQNPFAQARFAAITQAAVFEAVNAITGDYEPYLGTITAPPGASAEAAAVAAAHGVLRNYFPGSAASLDAARASSLAAIPEDRKSTRLNSSH